MTMSVFPARKLTRVPWCGRSSSERPSLIRIEWIGWRQPHRLSLAREPVLLPRQPFVEKRTTRWRKRKKKRKRPRLLPTPHHILHPRVGVLRLVVPRLKPGGVILLGWRILTCELANFVVNYRHFPRLHFAVLSRYGPAISTHSLFFKVYSFWSMSNDKISTKYQFIRPR